VRWFARAVAAIVAGLPSAAVTGCGRIDFPTLPIDAAIDAVPDAPPDTIDPCAATYTVMIGQSYYRFSATGAGWDVAEHACEADGRGSHLVVFDNTVERNMVEDVVKSTVIWVGITDRANPDIRFLDVMGVEPTFLPWQSMDPAFPGPGCVQFDPSSRLIHDQDCSTQVAYVCECDGIAALPSSY
jgi:hypothetical protein